MSYTRITEEHVEKKNRETIKNKSNSVSAVQVFFNSIRLFGQTYTFNGLIQQQCIYRIEVTNTYNVL